MKRTRSLLVLCVGLFLFAVEPVAAQNSINDQLIGELNNVLLYAAIPITLLVQAVLIYAVFKFRNNDDPRPTQENRRLEITWTVATAIVLLFVGLASYQVMADPFITAQNDDVPGEDAVEIDVVAYNYGWDFIYQDEGIESTSSATIPTDTEIYFNVGASEEQNSYIHGFHVPDLGLKQDANPGQSNTVKTEVYEEGEYQGYCSKYCGVGHSSMYFTIDAVSEDEYQQWVQEQQSSGGSGNESGGNESSGNESGNASGGNESSNASGGS
ncbi:cytochrome c oxidase subunit II [Halalkalicoccus subterraneus]|uniref:cytochrome c oxidase subunit II n=1 Tax=Halalkalicoccus subterraneus TaxID=2675002 RepID=UPI000EFBDC5C|nr:cytochrome c oxidase subunit II [Halalkalicoccus subterraneus]